MCPFPHHLEQRALLGSTASACYIHTHCLPSNGGWSQMTLNTKLHAGTWHLISLSSVSCYSPQNGSIFSITQRFCWGNSYSKFEYFSYNLWVIIHRKAVVGFTFPIAEIFHWHQHITKCNFKTTKLLCMKERISHNVFFPFLFSFSGYISEALANSYLSLSRLTIKGLWLLTRRPLTLAGSDLRHKTSISPKSNVLNTQQGLRAGSWAFLILSAMGDQENKHMVNNYLNH